jgi:hypothetical protein
MSFRGRTQAPNDSLTFRVYGLLWPGQEGVMHSLSIFVGVLLFAWGLGGIQIAYFIAKIPPLGDGFVESVWDRWVVLLVAIATLPVPIALLVGGGGMVRWGFLGG